SRTNRILNDKKSQGNIVCFRNLKAATDDAIALFSNKDAKETVLLESYDTYINQFNEATDRLLTLTPTVQAVDALPDERAQQAFIIAFRDLLRLKNVLSSFADFDDDDLALTPQQFNDYSSKYKDLEVIVKRRQGKEKTSILNDIDFELSLLHRDEINVSYILNLLLGLQKIRDPEDAKQRKKGILDLLAGEVQLRSKRALIQAFIDDNLPNIKPQENVLTAFEQYWHTHQQQALTALCQEENLNPAALEKLLHTYSFANRLPRDQEIIDALNQKPRILERKGVLERVGERIKQFIETFVDGMGGSV
ncbi:MAG: type I restriction endonuclease subunit R, partial [Yersinia sp. (in: enterobacteria)]